jgi:hypothetical protein
MIKPISAMNLIRRKFLILLGTGIAGWPLVAAAADFQLSWVDNANNETGFAIERKTGTSGSFSQRATVGANVRSYVDSNLPSGTTFCYRVRAYNSAGNSAFTPEACKTTPSGTTPQPIPPQTPNMVTLEAESGSLTAPMVVTSSTTASGGKYVQVPQGKGHNYSDSTKGGPGEVRFAISISQSGTRTLWAKTRAPDGASDSFYVTRNGSLVSEWNAPGSSTWKWNKVATLSLSAGTVNLAFRQREDGTQLDQIILTTDANFTPGQSGAAVAAVAFSESAGHVLSVNVVKSLTNTGSGDGTVTSSAGGIACGNDCAETYSSGAVVKLIASPAAGSTFDGWSGNADCSDGTVTMNSNVTCTATFRAQTLGLHLTKSGSGTGNVASSPSGIICGSDCSEPFASGTSVTLTATPAKGSIFKGWSGGGCKGTTKCTVVVSGSTSVSALFEGDESDHGIAKVGIYRPSTGDVFLDRNGNGEWDGCSVDTCIKWLVQAGGVPIAGDWEGTGTTGIGTFDATSGSWHLDRNGNGRWDGCNVDTCIKSFGAAGDFPLLIPNGTNRPNLGIYRSKKAFWQFDTNGNNLADECAVDTCYSKFGGPDMFGLIGDWDGSEKIQLASFHPESGSWVIDTNGNGKRNDCGVDKCYSGFGQVDDVPVAGDWDGSGRTNIGIFRPASGEWFLDKNGNGRLDSCGIDACIRAFGQPGDKPIVGKWLETLP